MSAIGPNALTRMAEALTLRHGEGACQAVFARAGIAHRWAEPPHAMVPEAEVAALHRAVHARFAPAEAAAMAELAGRLTGDYLLAHRIPRPARLLLPLLPWRLSLRLLCRAMAAHAWTFAGSGAFSYRLGTTPELVLAANPIATGLPPEAHGCHYHRAVFQHLLRRLVAPDILVREVACCAEGAPACVYRITRG